MIELGQHNKELADSITATILEHDIVPETRVLQSGHVLISVPKEHWKISLAIYNSFLDGYWFMKGKQW